MSTSTKPLYDTFDPQAYLQQFYATSRVTEDEAVNFRASMEWLRRTGRVFDRALEVGCGPTIHHALPLIGSVRDLQLCDYSAANLAAVRKWLEQSPDAHDWGPYIRGFLEIAELPATDESVKRCEDSLRQLVRSVSRCDLLRDPPLDAGDGFDLVTSYYTAECAAGSRDAWPAVMQRLLSLVRPGGVFVTTAMRNCDWYDVLGRRFPAARVNETDFEELLPLHGFDPAQTEIEGVRVHGWEDEGFDSIVLVRAVKSDVT